MTTPVDNTRTTNESVGASRRWAIIGMAGAAFQVAGGILEFIDRVPPGTAGYGARTFVMGIGYLMMVATPVALALSGAVGGRRFGAYGLAAAGAGWVLSAVAQFVLRVDVELAENVLFPIATVTIGVAMIVVGLSIIAVHQWSGWRRHIGLVCGLYPFAVTFPVFAATGGPNFLVFAVWGACWLLLGIALLEQTRRQRWGVEA